MWKNLFGWTDVADDVVISPYMFNLLKPDLLWEHHDEVHLALYIFRPNCPLCLRIAVGSQQIKFERKLHHMEKLNVYVTMCRKDITVHLV